MLLFNKNEVDAKTKINEFKYIQCYCSTTEELLLLQIVLNLNTSNVIVQLSKNVIICLLNKHLNTSNVIVQHSCN